tara:strand:+ start:492 stop:620 length:129 start_codon:yes stop_codon:yes gene_type:complete
MQKDPDLWSGCITGAWQEDKFLTAFQSIALKEVQFSNRSKNH